MEKNPTIAFIHTGYSWYLPYTLKQARSSNPQADIVLIGNGYKDSAVSTHSIENVKIAQVDEFRSCYKHMSSNSEQFELFCWLRWFYLLEYMKSTGKTSVLHLDSDALLYSSLEDIVQTHGSTISDLAYIIPEQTFDAYDWCASGHMSYWTLDALEHFCSFIISSYCENRHLNLYKEKWGRHVELGLAGGICDMTTLYLYWREHSSSITNLSKDINDSVFDNNISYSINNIQNEYKMDGERKHTHFDGKKVFFTKDDPSKTKIRAHAAHFQGKAKQHIPEYYTGNTFNKWSPYEIKQQAGNLKGKAKSAIKTLLGRNK